MTGSIAEQAMTIHQEFRLPTMAVGEVQHQRNKSKLPTHPLPPRLRPPQFGLRSLLLLVTACAVIFAASQWLPPIWVGALVLLVLSIFAHVAGNAIGTRLREIGSRKDNRAYELQPSARAEPRFAPATRLGQRQHLGWPVVIATFSGILLGGIGGGLWTILTATGQVPIAAVGLGVIAFAALGGILAFATVGFTQVLLGAIWQAMRQSSKDSSQSFR
jgi:hypothetical protein